jgi:hypothetical protein
LVKNKIFIWANDYSSETGEGRLARNFTVLIKKKYPNSLVIVKTPKEKFIVKEYKINKSYILYKNNFFNKYVLFFYGIFYLWRNQKNKIVYINYLPLWNFLIFLLLPQKTILGPITGGVYVKKIDNLENFIRILLFPIFYKISLLIINLKFRKILFSTNLLKKYLSNKNKKNLFFGYVYNLFLTKNYLTRKNKIYDLIFYNRNYNSKKSYLVKNIILELPKELKVCVIGDKCEGENFINKGYVSHEKVLKLISQSKMAFGTSENLLSLFAIDCYNFGVKLIYDKNTLLNNIISTKNSIVVNYKNPINSSKSILNEIEKYKFMKDLKFMKFLEKKKKKLEFFLSNFF